MLFLLRLKGPFQSWAKDKRTTNGANVDTYECPTFSGMLGMICACFGVKHTDEKYDLLKNKIDHLYTFSKNHCDILEDFQSSGGGYDTSNEVYRKNGKRKYDGSLGTGFECAGKTVASICKKQYIVDGDFFVILNVDEDLSKELEYYLKNPVWQPTLGKSNCIPSKKIFVSCGECEDYYINYCKTVLNVERGIVYSSKRPQVKHTSIQIFDIPISHLKNTSRTIFKSVY